VPTFHNYYQGAENETPKVYREWGGSWYPLQSRLGGLGERRRKLPQQGPAEPWLQMHSAAFLAAEMLLMATFLLLYYTKEVIKL